MYVIPKHKQISTPFSRLLCQGWNTLGCILHLVPRNSQGRFQISVLIENATLGGLGGICPTCSLQRQDHTKPFYHLLVAFPSSLSDRHASLYCGMQYKAPINGGGGFWMPRKHICSNELKAFYQLHQKNILQTFLGLLRHKRLQSLHYFQNVDE